MSLFQDTQLPKLLQRGVIAVSDLPTSGAVPDPAFIQSVKAYGVLSDIILVPEPDGAVTLTDSDGRTTRARVVDGLRRIEGARKAHVATVTYKLFDMAPEQADLATVVTNSKRSSNPVAELQAVERVMSKAIGEVEIAKATGIPVNWIRKLMKLRLLIPPLRDLFDAYNLKASVAFGAAALSDEKQQQLVAIYESTDAILAKHVSALKDGAQRGASGSLFAGDPSVRPESIGTVTFLDLATAFHRIDMDYQVHPVAEENTYQEFFVTRLAEYLSSIGIEVTDLPAECAQWYSDESPFLSEAPTEQEEAPTEEPDLAAEEEPDLAAEEKPTEDYDGLLETITPAFPDDPEVRLLVNKLFNRGIVNADILATRTSHGLVKLGVDEIQATILSEAGLLSSEKCGEIVEGWPTGGRVKRGSTIGVIHKFAKGKTGGAHILLEDEATMFLKWAVLEEWELL